MHELSLALSLLDGIEAECAAHGGLRVRTARLRLGALSGVSWEALRFAYEAASANTALAGSRLIVTEATPGTELELVGLEVDP